MRVSVHLTVIQKEDMYRFIQRKKNNRLVHILNFPCDIFRMDYRKMTKKQVRSLLVRTILGEKRSKTLGGQKVLRKYHNRLRKKRIEIAQHYLKMGGVISPTCFKQSLPSSLSWPGIIALVETKGFEEYLIKNV